jgi:hypothetical protein
MPAILKQRPLAPAAVADNPSSTALVAAVLANVEDCAGYFHNELSDREFRELVRARGRSCDAALLELRRAALVRGGGRPASTSSPRRGQISGLPMSADTIRVLELEAENAGLRRLIADQQLDIDVLRERAQR